MFKHYYGKLLEQLAVDYNCTPDDLRSGKCILTLPAQNEGRRWYSRHMPFMQMVTTGQSTVIMADERIHGFLREFTENIAEPHRLFEHKNLHAMDRALEKYGYGLSTNHHMFLPCRDVTAEERYPVKWFVGEDIMQFYGDERFSNTVCDKYTPERPDRIVVAAYDGDTIVGTAGCSEDAPHWQQIGIDVMPEYRSKGIGTYLVTLLKNRIIENGDIPFYGTAEANIHSQNIALNCGFKPAWVEIEARMPKNGD